MAGEPREVWQGITRLVRGGAQRIVLDLVRGLDRARFRPVLLAGTETGAEGSLWGEAEALGVEIIRVPTLVRAVAPWRDLRALSAVGRLIRERRPAIVHAHTSKAGFILCRAARRAGVPAVVLSPHGHILGASAQIPGVPSAGWRRRILGHLARRSADDADIVLCPNDAERDEGIALGMWREDRSVVVPNGVDTERFRPADRAAARRALGIATDGRVGGGRVVGTVARLTREKGIDLAVEAVAALPGVRLVIVGDGPERAALEERARTLGVADRVDLLGLRDDLPAIYPAFDALLVPSRTEAHGLVAAEALACAVPVVAARVGGLRSIVEEGTCGLFVPPDDPRAAADALRRILEDPPWAERLGRQGRARIIERWSLAAMLRGTEDLYERLLR